MPPVKIPISARYRHLTLSNRSDPPAELRQLRCDVSCERSVLPRHLCRLLCSDQKWQTNLSRRRPEIARSDVTYSRTSDVTAADLMTRWVPCVTDIPDEQQIWDQIQAIKAMPIPMDKKRERKNKLLVSLLGLSCMGIFDCKESD